MNFDKEGRGAYLPYAPKINETYYGGVDRMPWFEIDEDFFSGELPKQLIQLRKDIRQSNRDNNDIKLLFDLQQAIAVLDYSNKNDERNELVAVKSDVLEQTKGTMNCDADIKWVGIDIYCQGYGSLIREGIFKAPEAFSSFKREINNFGLIGIDSDRTDKYVEEYINNASAYNLEEIDIDNKKLDKIIIGKVKV